MSSFVGYRTSKVGGGGMLNGYRTPKAKQDWTVGQIVNVGFVQGLEVIKKISHPERHLNEGTRYVLRQASTNRFYSFRPHEGLHRRASLEYALDC